MGSAPGPALPGLTTTRGGERSPARRTPRRGSTSRARANWRSARARGAPSADRRSPIVPSAGHSARRRATHGSRGSRVHRASRRAAVVLVATRILRGLHRLRDLGSPGNRPDRDHRSRGCRDALDLASRVAGGASPSPAPDFRSRSGLLRVRRGRPGGNPRARASLGSRNRGRLAGPCRISRADPADHSVSGERRGPSRPGAGASRAPGPADDRRPRGRPPPSRGGRARLAPPSHYDPRAPRDRGLVGLAVVPPARSVRGVRLRVLPSTRPEPRFRRRSRRARRSSRASIA